MPYRISEASTLKGSGGLAYILVDFWRTAAAFDTGAPPILTNDFIMQLQREGQRIITRTDGWFKLTDGTFVDPADPQTEDIPSNLFARETVQRPTRQEVRENIRAYWQRAKAGRWSGDHTGDASKPFRIDGVRVRQRHAKLLRDSSDPLGVVVRLAPDVGVRVDDA